MVNRLTIGIDPGKSGGVAWHEPGHVIQWQKFPDTEHDLAELLHRFCGTRDYNSFAYLEKVGAMPGQGVTSMFSFGQSYGFLRGVLVALQIPFEDVRPQRWQKEFGLISRGVKLSATEKKNRNKQKAQQLWPGRTITHATADAALICEYGRRLG